MTTNDAGADTSVDSEGEEGGQGASDTGVPTDAGSPLDAGAATDAGGSADGGAVTDGGGVAALTTAEIELLTFTREEEKMARDVYRALASKYTIPTFANISGSEQLHMDAVLGLLVEYGIPDPAAGKAAGEFTNPTIQAVYDDLIARGATSLIAAIQVGLEIEERDIRDLTAGLAVTSHADIETVLENLLRGSRNHLRAYYDQLILRGGTYTPKFLDEATFLAIATSPRESGGPAGF